jgi:hypothetical protein
VARRSKQGQEATVDRAAGSPSPLSTVSVALVPLPLNPSLARPHPTPRARAKTPPCRACPGMDAAAQPSETLNRNAGEAAAAAERYLQAQTTRCDCKHHADQSAVFQWLWVIVLQVGGPEGPGRPINALFGAEGGPLVSIKGPGRCIVSAPSTHGFGAAPQSFPAGLPTPLGQVAIEKFRAEPGVSPVDTPGALERCVPGLGIGAAPRACCGAALAPLGLPSPALPRPFTPHPPPLPRLRDQAQSAWSYFLVSRRAAFSLLGPRGTVTVEVTASDVVGVVRRDPFHPLLHTAEHHLDQVGRRGWCTEARANAARLRLCCVCTHTSFSLPASL